MRGGRGTALPEYVGLVAAVGLAVGALLVVRPHVAGRQPPVRAVPAVVRLIGAPTGVLGRPTPVRTAPARPRVRRPRVRRPRPPPPVILLPEWLGGRRAGGGR